MRPNPQDVDLVIYHANCPDGFGAAWAAWKLLGDRAQYLPASYGDPIPNVAGKNVAILDFSYSRYDIKKMIEKANSLIVLDHHKTAQQNLAGIPEAQLDMSRSGAILSWQFFHGSEDPPIFLRYIEDRDLWRFELEDSKAVSAALTSLIDFTFESFDAMNNPSQFEELVSDGYTILHYNNIVMKKICQSARKNLWRSYEVCVVNSSILQSEIGSQLAPTCDFVVIWYYDHKNMKHKVSLRTQKNEVDVSKIAARFGGGGHKKAAGFTLRPPESVEKLFWPWE